ncbi:MAG: hypothetical protein ABIP39_06320 [Polyangiaceae bacterium]
MRAAALLLAVTSALVLSSCGGKIADDLGAAVVLPGTLPDSGPGSSTEDPRRCGPRALDCEGGMCIGGRCTPVVLAGNVDPNLIAQDADRVYVTDAKRGAIYAVPKDGGKLETLATLEFPSSGIAVGDGLVFFASSRAVHSVPVHGGADTVVAPVPTNANALALRGSSIYVLDSQAFGSVSAIDRATGTIRKISITASLPRAVTADGDRAYWSESFGEFFAEGGKADPTALGQDHSLSNVAAIVADDTNLYFTDASDRGRVGKIAKSGGPIATVQSLAYAGGLALTGDDLFVGQLGGPDGTGGALVKISKRTGEVTPLAEKLGRPTYLVDDGRRLFFVDVTRRTINKLVR